MRPLTARQQEVLELLKRHLETTGMPPTRAEISRELGFKSPNAAEEHLKALARKGAIEIVAGASRGIRIIDDSANDEEEEGLPLIGRVAAGEPILAEQHIEGTYRVDANMFKPQADFLLKVYGQSMKDIGILDGDLLAVHSTKDVRNGQIVVARIEDEVTVKRLERKGAIEIVAGASRGIRIIDDSANDEEEEGLPLIGRVAAGEPILAEQHIEGTYRVDANMFKPQADFLLKVYGQSMKDIGILDGDLLAVHSTKDVRNGQIVVARIEDEVTVKRLERKGSVIYLHAENEEFQPIVVNLEEQPHFEIEGIAVGIIRNNAWM